MGRKFEAGMWRADEKCAVYYEDKISLAHGIKLNEDELLDGLIEGIPDATVRAQARIQCFENTSKIMRAFAEVRLDKKAVEERKKETSKSRPNSELVKEKRSIVTTRAIGTRLFET